MTLHTRVAGTWRPVTNAPYVKVGGSWHLNTFGYVKIAGTWRNYYTYDTTGPANVTNYRATWNNGPCLVTWTNPPDSDFAGVQVQRYRGGVYDGVVANVTAYGAGAAAQYNDTDIRENYTIYSYYLYPYDALGNFASGVGVASMAWTNYARGRYPSPYVVDPNASGTWRNGAWRGDVANRPYQGYTSAGMNVGAFFYSGLNAITGATISNMTFDLYRVAAGGAGGAINPSLWLTQTSDLSGSDPSTTLSYNAIAGGVCRNGTCNPYETVPCPGTWYDALCNKNVLPGYYGVAFFDPDTVIQSYGTSLNYGQFYGAGESPGIVVPGRITITHTG